jgi:hypothetical protein
MGFVATGLGLIGLAVLLALRSANDMTSLAALLAGVLLLVVAGVGRLPGEVGLQRNSFGHPPLAAREYKRPCTTPSRRPCRSWTRRSAGTIGNWIG